MLNISFVIFPASLVRAGLALDGCATKSCYTGDVGDPVGKIDKPEPRWQALLALLAVGGIYVALPRAFVAGPKWALPVFIAVLTAPTVVAHRMGKHSWNRVLGIIISSVITLALIASVALLVAAVPAPQGRTDRALWLPVPNFGLPTCLSSLFGTGGLDGGGPPLVINGANSAAVALSFRKCRSKKLSAAALSARDGVLISSIIFLSPGRPVRLSVQPTRLYSPGGQRFSPWSKSESH